MDPAIHELLDKKACEEVLMRYSRTLDWLDYPGQSSCFWPNADIDYGFLKSDPAGWLDKLKDIESGSARRWHMTANSLIKIDGGKATRWRWGPAKKMASSLIPCSAVVSWMILKRGGKSGELVSVSTCVIGAVRRQIKITF